MGEVDPKVKIMCTFLENAPPGEFEQCWAALGQVSEDPQLLRTARYKSLEKWNHKLCTAIEIEGHSTVVCDESKVSDGCYIDSYTNTTFAYDFDTKVVMPTGVVLTQSSELREAFQKRIVEYINEAYKDQKAGGAFDRPDGSVAIVCRGASVSLRNFRTGIVIGKYIYHPDGKIEGRIEAMVHFFERGNALCQYGANYSAQIKQGNPEEVASASMNRIADFEEAFYEEYTTGLDKIGEEAMNLFRRKLPVTRTKINWETELTLGNATNRA